LLPRQHFDVLVRGAQLVGIGEQRDAIFGTGGEAAELLDDAVLVDLEDGAGVAHGNEHHGVAVPQRFLRHRADEVLRLADCLTPVKLGAQMTVPLDEGVMHKAPRSAVVFLVARSFA
jgi:hypothetical protein